MKKQIMLISEGDSDIKAELVRELEASDYYLYHAEYKVNSISNYLNRTDRIILLLDGKDDDMSKILLFLRDICIDEEKFLYLIGKPDALSEAASKTPAMITGRTFSLPAPADEIVFGLNKAMAMESKGRVLYIGKDGEFLSMLRRFLQGRYEFAATDADIQETDVFINDANLVILDTRIQMSLAESLQLGLLIRRAKEKTGFKLIATADPEIMDKYGAGVKVFGADKIISSAITADRLASVF